MAKKPTLESKDLTQESTDLTEFRGSDAPPPLLPQGFDASKVKEYGQDNDPYNQWTPVPGETKLLVFRSAVKVPQDNGRYEAILCTFIDLETGRPLNKFLGAWLVKEMVERGYHQNNLPLQLTYGGKVRRKRNSDQGEPDTHNWKRYYFTADEWSKLTGSRVK